MTPEDCDLEKTPANLGLRRQRRLYAPGVLSTMTDARGSFVLDHAPDETWSLVARAPGFAPSELIVVSGEDERFELELARLSSIHGRVVEATIRLCVYRTGRCR